MRLNRVFIVVLFFCFITKVKGQSTIERIGDYGLYSLPVVALGTTVLEKDFKGSLQFTEAFALNVAVSFGLKAIVKKERPNGEDFKSFPSAHTSVTFQSAAFLQKRYGWNYGIPAYVVAAYTGFSRVHVKKHFVEDVVAGAAIGVLSSYLFTRKRKEKKTSYFSFGKQGKEYTMNYRYQF